MTPHEFEAMIMTMQERCLNGTHDKDHALVMLKEWRDMLQHLTITVGGAYLRLSGGASKKFGPDDFLSPSEVAAKLGLRS